MIGKTLAHYEITSQIGKGGMGEVYRVTDTKLGREVAIKVLPREFAKDVDRVARFQREAKLLASLNHPNIAAIHGLEEVEGTHFLDMELIEGQTLDDRIKSGAIPVEETQKLASQIAEALEAAHEKGVIHRDLKPANIKVTPDGKVKVLDFGLAKALYSDKAAVDEFASTTDDFSLTRPGTTVGTVAYMSPEQAGGEEAVQQWQQMLKITPDNVWGYINLGAAQQRMKRGDEVIDNLQIAARIAPDNIAALNNLGTAYLDLGRYEDAVEPYMKALEIDARNSVILGNLAKAYSKLPGRSKEAYESYRRAAALVEEQLNENPRDATALSRLATYYGLLGERAKALEKIKQATAVAPRDVEVCVRAVLVYEDMEQREEALFWLGKALELNFPKDRIEANTDLRALVADPRYAGIVQQHASQQ